MSRIFILKGITKEFVDSLDDIFDNKILDSTVIHEYMYDKIPPIFTTPDVWVKSTNLHCMNCSEQFSNPPAFIPKNPREQNGVVTFDTYGNFCSWNCVCACIDTRYNIDERWQILQCVHMVYKIIYDINVIKIQPSPDKSLMDKYGGNISSSSYRKLISNLKDIILEKK